MEESLDRTSKTLGEKRNACENLDWKTAKKRPPSISRTRCESNITI